MKINEKFEKKHRREKIVQFGEGVFLRGFADVFFQMLNDENLTEAGVVLVKPRRSEKPGMFDKLKEQDGMYTHIEQGIKDKNKTVVKRKTDVIERLINPYEDYESYISLAKNADIRVIISNTTEAGIVYKKEKYKENEANEGFPAKLCALLYERYKLKLDGFYIIPCELIDNAGDTLKKIILQHADDWNLGDDFKKFVCEKNKFYNTLVDRIVTGFPENEKLDLEYEDEAVNTSEIYHLWVLSGERSLFDVLPFDKSGLNILISDDLDMYHERKVRILNGLHTCLAPHGLLCGFESVGQCVEDKKMNDYLCAVRDEITASLDMDKKMLSKYAESVFERFSNPYIYHRLQAISLNSISKFKTRVLPSLKEYKRKFNKKAKTLSFAFYELLKLYRSGMANDTDEMINIIKTSSDKEIMQNKELWGESIEEYIESRQGEEK